MIKTLLIANRGEIACRIIKAAKNMGIKTVAVYSDADANSLHVRMADKAIYLGPSPSTQSYLNQKAIMRAIKLSGADAVHPGYGFLSENSKFVELLEKNNIIFIGPSAYAVKAMGDKIEAKKIAQASGVSIVPGAMADIKNEKDAIKIANKVGYPVMVKAAAGGGGKGMRIVRSDEQMHQAFSSTRNEAKNNFADARLFIEKFIENPRHIEIQIIADKYGNIICLGERECSIQRHNQKVIEEAPSSFIDEKTRKKMYAQSVALAKQVGYYSAGTIEFIVDQKRNFYFLEMNTRLQVEHPVTEFVTGKDLVELMIRVASNEKLSFKQSDIVLKGWAFESRIYAEDPAAGFLPSIGHIMTYKEPEKAEWLRIDSGVYEGAEVSMFYDAMIAKLVTYGQNRQEAIANMQNALGKFVIRGISSNISFLQTIFNHAKFAAGDITTKFIDQEWPSGFSGAELTSEQGAVLLASSAFVGLSHLKRNNTISGQLRSATQSFGTRWIVMVDKNKYPVTVRPIDGGYKVTFENRKLFITSDWVLGSKLFECQINGIRYSMQTEPVESGYVFNFQGNISYVEIMTPRTAELRKFIKENKNKSEDGKVKALISGSYVTSKVALGEQVNKGQVLCIVEAMKMENIITSPKDGRVFNILKTDGSLVTKGETLIEIIDLD